MNEVRFPELLAIEKEIKGKRVAIVGNARTIFDKKNGKEIDNHDFIIRFNRGFVVNKDSQGSRTDLLVLACPMLENEAKAYKPRYIANRSKSYKNAYANFTINSYQRAKMKQIIGAQPSSGFMLMNICLYFKAAEIDLYGFDGITQSWPNDPSYVTQHDYDTEQKIIQDYAFVGLIKIN